MKKIKHLSGMQLVVIVALTLISFVSCTAEFPTEIQSKSAKEISTEMMSRNTPNYPENPENPYDIVGQLSVIILDDYLHLEIGASTTQSVINQVEGLAQLRAKFLELVPNNYNAPPHTTIDSILLIHPSDKIAFAKLSEYSSQAKITLFRIMDSLVVFQELKKEDFIIKDFIINYEAAILSDSTLTPIDKKMLLTTTSIAPDGLFYAKERPRNKRDRDWEISWGNMYAPAVGSKDNQAKALIMAVAVGILYNK